MATQTTDVQATVNAFIEAVLGQNLDAARQLLHPDFVAYEAADVPYSGEFHGPDGFFDLLAKMNEVAEISPQPPMKFLLAEDTVAINCRLKFTSRASGDTIETGMVELYTVRDGKVAQLDVYYKDPAAVAKVLV